MVDLFEGDEEINVFAQRSPFINEEFLNPVTFATNVELLSGGNLIDILLDDIFPGSYSTTIRKLIQEIEDPEGDILPYDLGNLTYRFEQGEQTQVPTYPLFWVRKDNIDIDSTWWNFEDETGLNLRDRTEKTNFNDEYWLRDPNDPDINRIPNVDDPDFKLLSERTELLDHVLNDRVGIFYNIPVSAVPYEIVYPEWFKLHPEFVQVNDVIKDFNLDVRNNILVNLRESEDNNKIDHLVVGFFSGILPKGDKEAEYVYRFFRYLFKDYAFKTTLTKQISPCISNLLDIDGFYSKQGDPLGTIEDGSSIVDLKNNNYFYEYIGSQDSTIDHKTIFRFDDPVGKLRIDLDVKDIIIRKVRGTLPDNKQIQVTVGKGATFPEFTYFGNEVYPTDPTNPAYSAAELSAYSDSVLSPHKTLFQGVPNILGVGFGAYPQAYVAIRYQRNTTSINSIPQEHEWDTETFTDLNPRGDFPYYEEIILIDPRVEYREAYSENFKSKRAYKAFYESDFWLTADRPDIFIHNGSTFIATDIGSRFSGNVSTGDALAVPILPEVTVDLPFVIKEEIIARGFCLFVVGIDIVEIDWYETEEFSTAVQIGFFVFNVFTGGAGSFLENLVTQILLAAAFQALAVVVVELLVEEFGFEAAGAILAALTIAALYFKIKLPADPTAQQELVLQVASNFSDSYITLVEDDIVSKNLTFQEEQAEIQREFDEVREQVEDLLLSANPNISLQTLLYSPPNETASEFFNRTIGNLNPGVDLLGYIASEFDRYKFISHTQLPEIHIDDPDTEERFEQLI